MARPRTQFLFIPAAAACLLAAGKGLAQEHAYRIVDLTELAEQHGVAQSEARAVNELGVVVGFEALGDFKEQAILWRPDGTVELLPRLDGDNSDLALGVSDEGDAIGISEHVRIEQHGNKQRVFEDQKAVVWSNDGPVDLNTLWSGGGGDTILRSAWDINAHRQMAIFARQGKEPPFTRVGFLYDDGETINLGLLTRPVALNDAAQVVGWSTDGQDNAYLWDAGDLTNLHDDPQITGVVSRAFGINNAGLIVGEAQFDISRPEEPTLWTSEGAQRLIPEFNRPQGVAAAVNDRGLIVGSFNDLDDVGSPFRGFLWRDGVWVDLLDLIPPDEGWEVLFPFDINDRGWIVGGGVRNGELGHAFLMIPEASPADLDEFAIVTGTLLEGELNDLIESDDMRIHTRSGFGETLVNLHNMTMDVGAVAAVNDPVNLDLTIEARIDEPAGTAVVSLRNWSTGEFETVHSYAIGTNEEAVTIPGLDARRFVSGGGEIDLRAGHVVFVPFLAFTFESFVDQVRIEVN